MSTKNKNILVVIPARGGSKGIPRKNLRLLGGKPLLYYSITTALNSKFDVDVYVTSDDSEILHTAKKIGAKTHKRSENISEDETTLDPVIYDCYLEAKKVENIDYPIIITLQPTSPLLSTHSLDSAIQKIIDNDSISTIIAAKDATHLSWRKENQQYVPNYIERVNRQYLPTSYTETGAFLITRESDITENNRIGKHVDLAILNDGEEIDIDTYEDWNLCEYYLNRKHILFVVTGNSTVGLGHVYNTLLVANDILNHQITFLVDKESKLAYNVISSNNYPVIIQDSEELFNDIIDINPDIIINDRLDTSDNYMKLIKNDFNKIINFEDLGAGCNSADLVINAMYPEKKVSTKHYFGQEYFILRDEFILSEKKIISKEIKNVLITFGGVDPNNFTEKVIKTINEYCIEKNIKISVIAGFGYTNYDTLQKYKNVIVQKNVSNISDFMLEADLIFTSGGRTVYEVASIGTPTIVMGQNRREMTHFFASSEFGFSNLGLGYEVTDEKLLNEFKRVMNSYESRKQMSDLMMKQNLKLGRKRVHKLIQDLIKD